MKIFRPFLVVISSLVLLFMVAILLFMLANSMLSPRREMNGSDWHYYQDIVEKYKNGSISQFSLHDIFKFDWDYLYVSTYPEIDYASLKNQLGINSEILPLDRNENMSRVLFIKNNIIVYDFKFSRDILLFLPGNICVQRSQALVSVDKDNGIMFICFAYHK